MRITLSFLLILLLSGSIHAQDYYDIARKKLNQNQVDSARFYINKNLSKKPDAGDYFLSAMIHEAENRSLRALADYEAVIQRDPDNLEAFFKKGLIYYNIASTEQAIKDFSYVIENSASSTTRAVYYASDPTGAKGTFLTTLQSMIGRVYQYRGLAYQKIGEYDKALTDFSASFKYDSTADSFVNRSQLYAKMGRENDAIKDLQAAIRIDSSNYHAWYNLAILDESTQLPSFLLNDKRFAPMLNLVGANAYESEDFRLSASYYSSAINVNPDDELAYLGRGKALLRMGAYSRARQDFVKALQLNAARSDAFYLIGNTFFHEKKYGDAIRFYEQYLQLDRGYENVWFNAAMAYLNLKNSEKACSYLEQAERLGMEQAITIRKKHCVGQ